MAILRRLPNGWQPYLYSFPAPASKLELVPEAVQETPIPAGIEEAPAVSAVGLPPPTTPLAPVSEVIAVCRRPANDLIKILKTMIWVAAVKQCQPVRQQVDGTEASARLAAKPLQPMQSQTLKEATLGELLAERGGEAQKRQSGSP